MSGSDRSHYAVLGLSTDASTVLIKAAYRTLAKQYHPDTHSVEDQISTEKFTELHDAYVVLADPSARKAYDKEKGFNKSDDLSSTLDEQEETRIELDEIWREAEIKYPEINQIHAQFCLISIALANQFSLAILNRKYGDNPKAFAAKLELKFFKKYFGNIEVVQILAKRLLLHGHKIAARELNEAVKSKKLQKKSVWEHYIRIIEKKYPDIVEPVSPQFNDDMSTQAETFGDQNASQNTNHGNGYGHDVSTLGRSAKFFGFATAVAFFLLAVFVSTLFYALKTGGEIKLKQSPSGSALQANQQIFDRMVGESLARAGQINVTEETPFKSATTSKTEVLPERDLMGGFALNWS